MNLLDTALRYHHAGLIVLPNDPQRKFPAGLRGWEQVTPTERDIRHWFGNGKEHAIGVRDVEGLDIDNKGNPDADDLYRAWEMLIEKIVPGLAARLLRERTPSGGLHLVWRCDVIAGNQKLATRPPTPAELESQPRLSAVTLIETRGKGGQFQVAPSPGYTLLSGDWAALPVITPAERLVILDCARALSKADKRVVDTLGRSSGERAGDRYNQEGADDALRLLEDIGWAILFERDDAKYLTRPGKDRGVSATFGYVAPGVLYVFSSNASPFDMGRAYSPFAVLTELKHGGDYKAAARALHAKYERQPGRRVDVTTGEVHEETPVRDWRHGGVTAADLYHTQFAPLIWTVENICPEGAVLIAGKPKSRKSWAALGIAVSNAMGRLVFGKLTARQGRVLYLDLESNQRRMRGRLFSMVGHQMQGLDNLHIYTEWPRAEEALEALEQWMLAYPDTVLIVIDVLADFRRPKGPQEDIYLYDRETVKPINEFAERHRITVALVHHTRKAKADDVFDEISGSTGLPSAVATMWVLGRAPNGSGEMVLAMRGRDLINDDPLALEWDDYDNHFKIVGGAVDALQSSERRAVLGLMADDQEWAPKDIAAELKKPVNNVQQLIKVLLSEGLIERTGRGKYVRVLSSDQNDQNHHIHKNHKHAHNFDSDLRSQDQNQDQNRLSRPNALNSHSDHSDRDSRVKKSDVNDLFTNDAPEGLTAEQWEQARYYVGTARWSELARLAQSIPMEYKALKALVERSAQ